MEKGVSKKERKGVEDGGETKDAVWLKDRTRRGRQEAGLKIGEVKILRLSFSGTMMERFWNESIRGTAHGVMFGGDAREDIFGRFQRRDSEDVGERMLRMEMPGRRPGARAQSRRMDL